MERWTKLWVLAIALLSIGALLLFVPTIPNGTHTVTPAGLASGHWYFYEVNVTAFSVTGSVPFTLYWGSSTQLYLDYAICPTPLSNFTGFFDGSSSQDGCALSYGLESAPPNPATSNPGLSLSVPPGGSVVLAWGMIQAGPTPISITYTAWTGVTWVSPILLVGGVWAALRGRADWIDEKIRVAKIVQDAIQHSSGPDWRD